jgi:transposase InsO family protein
VQFTAKTFRRRLRRHRIGHRIGAVGRSGSIALIERFWRTIKDAARVRSRPPLSAVMLEARLHLTLAWYTAVRSHSALDGATPGDQYQGRRRGTPARSPPRGRRGDGTLDTPFTIAFVDPDRTLPVLVRRAA